MATTTSKNHLAPPDAATTPAPMRPPLPGILPGAATYLVLAIWSGLVTTAHPGSHCQQRCHPDRGHGHRLPRLATV